jgi:hypothetical protein
MSEQSPNPEQARKAQLNDEFRRNGPNGNWFITQGVQALPDMPGLIRAVQAYHRFTPVYDPYGEHDFGGVNWHHDTVVLWKIDYYDQELVYGEDPLSPECRRVLTILLASEY